MIASRKMQQEEFHTLAVTADQLNLIAYALRTLQDQYEQERSDDREIVDDLELIDEIMISIDTIKQ